MQKYRQYNEKFLNLTETKISEKIADYFNHILNISQAYMRLTFNSLSAPLATKRGIS